MPEVEDRPKIKEEYFQYIKSQLNQTSVNNNRFSTNYIKIAMTIMGKDQGILTTDFYTMLYK